MNIARLVIITFALIIYRIHTDLIAMDIGPLEQQCAALSLAEEEAGGMEVPEMPSVPDETIHHNLVGRFLTDRVIKAEHMQQVFASVWRPVMGMYAVTLTEDLFLFQFPHPKDLQRVIEDGPWSFDNQLLICDQVLSGTRPEEVVLDSVPFWVQIHGLPTMYASPAFVAKIGEYVGTFIAPDPLNFGGAWRSFFRIRVRLNVLSPLKRRMKLLRRDGSSQWITFRYERLGTFCYCCGLLGHSDKFCKTAYELNILPDAFPFGAWMRAGPRRQARPVGARWLLSSGVSMTPASSTPEIGIPPATLVTMEEDKGLHGDLKRRREEGTSSDSVHDEDVRMVESSKNSEMAGLVDQARPDQ
ncbi:PREDICTED: uncharacterized protein LOC109172169 [Ipomoea nil]|uniref:uncharacterized protein LOC109172169 n=1 Tax=Ipomoea nil TaxID=35883 RepID=UPI000900B3C0|nr:PREDICTED: uncharacterized protein LOC109172169 [Ipomoea nil]